MSGARLTMYSTEKVLRFSGIDAPLIVILMVQAALTKPTTAAPMAAMSLVLDFLSIDAIFFHFSE